MAQIWLNGGLVKATAVRIAPSDRGFLLADGVFETIRASAGELLWLDDHLARLRAGAGLLGIPVPLPDDAIGRGLRDLVQANDLPDGAVRLTLTRGPSVRRGLWPPDEPATPTLIATVAPFAAPISARLILCGTTRRNEFSPLSRIKYLAYGDAILAKREALAMAATDAVLLNTRGHVACCTVGNLFARDESGWATPPLSDGPLPGLARARVLAALGAEERTLTAEEIAGAREALITNSLGITVVSQIEDRPLATPPISTELAAIYRGA
jgi:branched-subunit amino acid aminotransferase/4-amino-4-deoxychorismate lyase